MTIVLKPHICYATYCYSIIYCSYIDNKIICLHLLEIHQNQLETNQTILNLKLQRFMNQ